MKVLLLQNVKKLGQKGQIVDVKEGYGINFLIKNGLAKSATATVQKSEIKQQIQRKNSNKKKLENKLKTFSEINKEKFIIQKNTNEKGHLFAGINKKEIAKTIGLEEKNILLEKDIREIGEYEIKVVLAEKKGKINLTVEKL